MPHTANITLLRDFIDRHQPEQCEMSAVKDSRPCGTIYCLLGFARELWDRPNMLTYGLSERLEIDKSATTRLISGNSLMLERFDELHPSIRKATMLQTLDLLAETGEVRWEEALEANTTDEQYDYVMGRKGLNGIDAEDRESSFY